MNLDGRETPESAWDDEFGGIDLQDRFASVDFDDYIFDHSWEQSESYNWKVLADHFNESYHFPTSHPDVTSSLDPTVYSVDTIKMSIVHNAPARLEQIERRLNAANTYFFPNASTSVT